MGCDLRPEKYLPQPVSACPGFQGLTILEAEEKPIRVAWHTPGSGPIGLRKFDSRTFTADVPIKGISRASPGPALWVSDGHLALRKDAQRGMLAGVVLAGCEILLGMEPGHAVLLRPATMDPSVGRPGPATVVNDDDLG